MIKIALDSCSYCSLHQNPLLANSGNNMLVGRLLEAPLKSNSSLTSISCTFIMGFALIPTPAPVSGPAISSYIDKNLQRTTKLALKFFFQSQKHV